MTDKIDPSLRYVRFVLEQEKLKPSKLAKMIGVSTTTLTRPMNDPEQKSTISLPTLQRIMEVTGWKLAPFFDADGSVVRQSLELQTGNYFRPADPNPDDELYQSTIVIGSVQIGNWLERRFFTGDHFYILRLTASTVARRKDCFGLKVVDDSCDKFAARGVMLFCELMDTSKLPPVPGSIWIVERQLKMTKLFEISARVVRYLDDGRAAYHAHTSRKELEGFVIEGETDTETVRVVARVEYAVSRVWDREIFDEENEARNRAKLSGEHDQILRRWDDGAIREKNMR